MKRSPFYPFAGNVIIRLLAGLVFLSEGIQKLLFPVMNGSGRFAKIGIPYPDFFGPFVGITEIVCGLLLLMGWFSRIAAIPLLIVIITAICTTKLPELMSDGFWKTAHDGRADFSMLMGLIFLLIFGSGRYSVDELWYQRGK
jgi:putative oxidoreductase